MNCETRLSSLFLGHGGLSFFFFFCVCVWQSYGNSGRIGKRHGSGNLGDGDRVDLAVSEKDSAAYTFAL